MKKNIKIMLISILTFLFIYTPNVFAASEITSREAIKIDGQPVYKRYDNTATGQTGVEGGDAGVVTVTIDGKQFAGFCIDFGISISTGTSNTPVNLHEYFRQGLSEEATNALMKKMSQYARYGYGSSGRTTDKYYLATQQLIWQAISDTGFYTSDYYANLAGKKIKVANFAWTVNRGSTIDLSAEISNIENSIKQYYQTPSFCSSQNKIEIEVGETAEYTDNNNVLSQYQVTCGSGITCQTEGNKLTVTAHDETGSHQISFSKPASGGESYVYKVGSYQGIIVDQGTLDAVSCEFGIDTFKNVQTSDMQIVYVITIGLFCGTMAYIAYYTKKSLDGLK